MPYPYDVSYPLTISGSNVVLAADGTSRTVLAQLTDAIPADDCKRLDLQTSEFGKTWQPVLSGVLNLSGIETIFMRVALTYPGDPSPPIFPYAPYSGELQPKLMLPPPVYYSGPWDLAPPGAAGNFQFNLYHDASHSEYAMSHRSDCQFLIYGQQFFPGTPIGTPGFDVTVSDLLLTLYRHPASLFVTPLRFYAGAAGQPSTLRQSSPTLFSFGVGLPQTVSFSIPVPPAHSFPFPAGVWCSAYWRLTLKGQSGGTETVDVGGNTVVFPARAAGGVFTEDYLVASADQMALIRAAAGGNIVVTISTTDTNIDYAQLYIGLLSDDSYFKVLLTDIFSITGTIDPYPNCCYIPTPDVEWIHIGAIANGCGTQYSGGNPVWFAIDPNPTNEAREGHILLDMSSDVLKKSPPEDRITIYQSRMPGNPPPPAGENSGDQLDYDTSDAMRHARAFRRTGNIWTQILTDVTGDTWKGANTGITGSRPCIRFAKTGQQQRLWLVYDNGTNVYRVYSDDEGGTWSVAETIGAGKYPTLVVTRHKAQYIYWVSGTAIKGKVFDDAGNILVSEFTAVTSGVDDSKISAKEHIRAGGEWHIKLLYTASGTITSVDSVDGMNFS